MRYRVAFLDNDICIDSTVNLKELWGEILSPYMEIEEVHDNWMTRIHFALERNESASKEFEAEKDKKKIIELHCGKTGKFIQRDNTTLISVDDLPVFYLVKYDKDSLRFNYYFNEFSDGVSVDFLQIVRGVLISAAEMQGYVKAHMAVVSNGTDGFGFIGNEGAGKTSFMLSFLRQDSKSTLVTNDKVVLTASNDKLMALGLPYAISVGKGSMESCKELQLSPDTRIINEEAYFWPQEVVQRLERSLITHSDISLLIVVKINPNVEYLECVTVDNNQMKAKYISEYVLNFSDKVSPHWLKKWTGFNSFSEETIKNYLCKLQMIRLNGNPWNSDFGRLIYNQLGQGK